MSYPTANLVARYEPKDWGYSDGDVINNTTKKFLDGSGNGRDLTTVTGSPTYKTGIAPNGQAVVRFSGTTQAVAGLFSTGQQPGTIAAVIIPRALPGGNQALFSYNDVGVHNGPLVYYDGTHLVGFANGTGTTSNTYTPVIDTAALVWIDYDSASSLKLRVNKASAATATGTYTGYTATRFSVAYNGFSGYFQQDTAALFIYSARLTGTDLSDLEDYLYVTYIYSATNTNDAMVVGAYTDTGRILTGEGYKQAMPVGSYVITGHIPQGEALLDAMPSGSYVYADSIPQDAFGNALPTGVYTVVGHVPMAGLVEPMPSGLYVIAGRTIGTIIVQGVFTPSNLDRNAIFAAGGNQGVIFAPGDSNGRVF